MTPANGNVSASASAFSYSGRRGGPTRGSEYPPLDKHAAGPTRGLEYPPPDKHAAGPTRGLEYPPPDKHAAGPTRGSEYPPPDKHASVQGKNSLMTPLPDERLHHPGPMHTPMDDSVVIMDEPTIDQSPECTFLHSVTLSFITAGVSKLIGVVKLP
jgi:hypothetical protein